MNYQTFIFDSYEFDPQAKRLELRYNLDNTVKFIETFKFDFDFTDYDQEALDRALFGLFILAGVSYYKVSPAAAIEIRQGGLSSSQAAFFAKTYRLGLGEFSFRNHLPLVDAQFPVIGQVQAAKEVKGLSGSLVPVGGGKDSLVTIELLREEGEDIVTWMVNHNDQIKPLIAKTGVTHLAVTREIAPELVRLNQDGALNGHVPITGILSFAGVVSAILAGKANVVLSMEWSAGEGNVDYQGVTVNHQYSKSFEFEQDFQHYVKTSISPSFAVFSLLRPLSELKIAETLCQKYLDKYAGSFSSCNRNYHLGDHAKLYWCGECPKCAFVFLIFAPFLPKDRLIGLFGGKNLFTSELLRSTFDELLGVSGHKPFECVGEIKECRQAVTLAQESGQWPELDRYDFGDNHFDYNELHTGSMPGRFEKLVHELAKDGLA